MDKNYNEKLEERLSDMIECKMSIVKDVRRRTLYGLVAILVAIGSWWIGNINSRVRDVELTQASANQEVVELRRSVDRIESKINALVDASYPGRR